MMSLFTPLVKKKQNAFLPKSEIRNLHQVILTNGESMHGSNCL